MYRLLIVDDEKIILDSLYGFLCGEFSFEIYRAQSAQAALSILEKMSIDMIVSDISMPKMSGLELLDIVTKKWPQCRVLLLTAYNDFNYAYHALRYPHVRYLLKIESYEEIKRNIQEMKKEIKIEREKNQLILNMDLLTTVLNKYTIKIAYANI